MSSEPVDQVSSYIHGSSTAERKRLSILNTLLNRKCLSELNPKSEDKVLDVGCGLGQFSRSIARAVGVNGHVLGIERDTQQHAQARALAESDGELDLVDFREGDAMELPLKDHEWESFDVAHCRFLLEHLPDPEGAVAQMVKAVRPGGRVFVIDDDHDYFHPWPEPAGFPALWQAYVRSYERLGNEPFYRASTCSSSSGGRANVDQKLLHFFWRVWG